MQSKEKVYVCMCICVCVCVYPLTITVGAYVLHTSVGSHLRQCGVNTGGQGKWKGSVVCNVYGMECIKSAIIGVHYRVWNALKVR